MFRDYFSKIFFENHFVMENYYFFQIFSLTRLQNQVYGFQRVEPINMLLGRIYKYGCYPPRGISPFIRTTILFYPLFKLVPLFPLRFEVSQARVARLVSEWDLLSSGGGGMRFTALLDWLPFYWRRLRGLAAGLGCHYTSN